MTLTINLPTATLDQIRAEVRATGQDVETFVLEAVESKLARRQTFAEVLKPIHEATAASGMSEDEATALFDQELKNVRSERRSAQVQP